MSLLKKKKQSAVSKAMSVLGSTGGTATFKKHGSAHMRKIVSGRWAKTRAAKKKTA